MIKYDYIQVKDNGNVKETVKENENISKTKTYYL